MSADVDPAGVAEAAIAFHDDETVTVSAQVATTALIELRGLINRTGGPDACDAAVDPLDDLTFRAFHELRDGRRLRRREPDEPVSISRETAGVALRELAFLAGPEARAPAPRRALQRTATDELVDVLGGGSA